MIGHCIANERSNGSSSSKRQAVFVPGLSVLRQTLDCGVNYSGTALHITEEQRSMTQNRKPVEHKPEKFPLTIHFQSVNPVSTQLFFPSRRVPGPPSSRQTFLSVAFQTTPAQSLQTRCAILRRFSGFEPGRTASMRMDVNKFSAIQIRSDISSKKVPPQVS